MPLSGPNIRIPLRKNLQLARGEAHLLFDRVAGQCRLAVIRGGEVAREELLGLGKESWVVVEPRLPERPLVLDLDPLVVLAPRGRLKGYLAVPVAWRVWLEAERGQARLLETLDSDLKLSFLGPAGYAHPLPGRLRVRRFLENEPTQALLPLHLWSREEEWREVRRLFVPLAGSRLHRVGTRLVADPVRVRFEPGGARLQVRPFLEPGSSDRAREAAS